MIKEPGPVLYSVSNQNFLFPIVLELKGIKGNSRNKEFIKGKSGGEKLSIKTVIFEMSL